MANNIRHDFGNSHIVRFEKIMMPPSEFLKCCYHQLSTVSPVYFFYIPESTVCSERFSSIDTLCNATCLKILDLLIRFCKQINRHIPHLVYWTNSGSCITKTLLYNFDPLKPHSYIVKLGFTGVYIISLISAQNIDFGNPLEPPRRGGSNEYPQSMF